MITKLPKKKYRDSIQLPKRDAFARLEGCLRGDGDKVVLLYGLRRTGKTTMMMQAIQTMGMENCRFLQCEAGDSFQMLKKELDKCLEEGIRYVFIDEVTKLPDFVNCSAVLYDFYSGDGLKLVLTGTDSLGLFLASTDPLLDRVFTIHTTYIRFGEFARLSGEEDLDDFIRYGGVLSHELDPKERVFYSRDTASHYLDSAISNNITNSFFFSRLPENFRHTYDRLVELHRRNALESCINKITSAYGCTMKEHDVEELVKNTFKSQEVGSTLQLLSKRGITLLPESANIDETHHLLAYYLSAYHDIEIDDETVRQIKDYLHRLDLLQEFTVRIYGEYGGRMRGEREEYVVQPGMRYCQSKALVEEFQNLGFPTEAGAGWDEFLATADLDIKGRIMEAVVLSDTKKSLNEKQFEVFQQKSAGTANREIDMVVHDKKNKVYFCFEVKHDTEPAPRQRRHLLDIGFLEALSKEYGRCACRCVLYRGTPCVEEGILYLNAGGFLSELYRTGTVARTLKVLMEKNRESVVLDDMFTDDDSDYG